MSGITFTYLAPTTPLRDWLRLQPGPVAALVGGPSASDARIFATDTGGLIPEGATMPAVAFHATPGAVYDDAIFTVPFQFDCYGASYEQSQALAAALASLLASTAPATRISPALVFHGPATIVDTFPLPVNINRVARDVLRARLTLAAF